MLRSRILPTPIRFALHTDLGLNAASAVFGPHYLTIDPNPIAQFGVLLAIGLILHELGTSLGNGIVTFQRWHASRA